MNRSYMRHEASRSSPCKVGKRINMIVNADDLNHSEEINAGIRQGATAGVITSTSAIVNTAILPSTVEIVCDFPSISVGLHFNLTRYAPLSAPSQVGSLLSNRYFSARSLSEGLAGMLALCSPVEIESELEAQWAKFLECFGQPPTHVDSHHYIHTVSPVKEVVLSFTVRHRVPLRRPERPGLPVADETYPGATMTDHLVFPFYGVAPTCELLDISLSRMRPGWSELVCHVLASAPVTNDYKISRQEELRQLSSTSFWHAVDRYGITLQN